MSRRRSGEEGLPESGTLLRSLRSPERGSFAIIWGIYAAKSRATVSHFVKGRANFPTVQEFALSMHYIHSKRLASPSSHCVLLPHNSARAARSSYTGPICSSTRGAIDKQNILLDNFGKPLERLGVVGAEKREWVMMAVVNIGSNLERRCPGGVLKTGVLGLGIGASAASTSSATAKMKLAKKQDDGDS